MIQLQTRKTNAFLFRCGLSGVERHSFSLIAISTFMRFQTEDTHGWFTRLWLFSWREQAGCSGNTVWFRICLRLLPCLTTADGDCSCDSTVANPVFAIWILSSFCKGFSNRDITILSMNKTEKYLKYWVQIYCGCSESITFYEWNLILVIWLPRARLQRSILWTQFSTTLAHISTGTLAISRWMLSLRSSKVAGLLA